jgi:hypothetical protein
MSERAAPRLELSREQILGHRRRVGELEGRLPFGPESMRRAAWAGLQDSMPRAALLSIHARVEGAGPYAWDDPSLVQLWGPRFAVYAVVAEDHAIFSLGRLPDDPDRRRFATDLADQLEAFLDGRAMPFGEAASALGPGDPNRLRYAAPTGRVLIRWDGARQPTIWTIPAPAVHPHEARAELARRYLHVLGPGTPASFGDWAGIKPKAAKAAFEALDGSLVAVRTPIGDRWILAADEAGFRDEAEDATAEGAAVEATAVRLLPRGDAYTLLQGADRELLVPRAEHREALWTPRVWPGSILVRGEIAGTWRRAGAVLTAEPWRRLSPAEHEAVEAEAASLPLPGLTGPIRVQWPA